MCVLIGMATDHIVVLGGGIGGVVAVTTLRDRLSDADADITLVDKSPVHTFKPTFLRLMTGESTPEETVEPLDQFNDDIVTFQQTDVTATDVENQQVDTSDGTIEYDYLIIALGVEYDESVISGFTDIHHVYTAEAAQQYRAALEAFDGGDLAVGVASLPYICPAAPVETALLTDHFLEKRGLREDTTMRFFFPGPAPMKKAGDNVGDFTVQALEDRGIAYYGDHALERVDSDAGELAFENGETLPYDLAVATPPHASPTVVSDSALADDSGWIPVDRETMETDDENVFAVGDNAKVMLPTIGKPLPKAGVFARKQAEVAAHNIANAINGTNKRHRFDGVGQCFLAARYGLSGKAGLVEADFFAEPGPQTEIKQPVMSRTWHWGKLLYERSWHRKWFPEAGGGEPA